MSLASFKKDIISEIKEIKSHVHNSTKIDVSINNDGSVKIINREKEQYNPSFVKTLTACLNDKRSTKKIIMGPYGSGKTSGITHQMLKDVIMMTPCDDGVRRYKWAIIRNTAGQLETTTLKTWEFWTQGLPAPHRRSKPQLTYTYNFNDEDGQIDLEVIFLALDRVDDVKKLDSLEITSAYINELRHMPKTIFDVIQSRIKRYPAKIEFLKRYKDLKIKTPFKDWDPYVPLLYADTNPPKNRHWIEQIDKDETSKILVYHQPPALIQNKDKKWIVNDAADNIEFQGRNYYLDMIDRGEEFIKVYGQGKYGTIVDGRQVYPNYNDDLHSIEDIPVEKNEPIFLGIDYGTVCPAIILQQVIKGQIRCIKEFIGDYLTIDALYDGLVKPYLNLNCKGQTVYASGDPADTYDGRAQLAKHNIIADPCRTNSVDIRISAVKSVLDKLINGKPRYIVSRKGCPMLRDGFLGEYHYRRLSVVGDEKYVDTPNKTHPYSDIHDANQYSVIKICDEEGIKNFNTWEDINYKQSFKESTRSHVTGY